MVAHFTRENNLWHPTQNKLLEDIKLSCVEYSHGGLWNKKYSRDGMISVDMVTCYPGSFLGYGNAAKYFTRFGHPTHEMTRVAINGPLPDFDLTGFACVRLFELSIGLHPCSYIWIGKHVCETLDANSAVTIHD